ncbi:MAG: radical SAM protein [Deltaproteobacteria bacterium]|nr:radical SAM protein [Deltaproteobacteria bacterium]
MVGTQPASDTPATAERLGVGPVPVGTITLELTRRCHRRCAFCYVPSLQSPEAPAPEELPAAALVGLARELMGATGCQNVQLSGGEPLLRPDLLALIEGLRNDGASVSIITDGAQLDEPLARDLAALGVGSVQPTLLSGDALIHNSLRGAGAFRAATSAIAAGAAADLEVIVCMVITRRNWDEAGRVAELAFALGARGLALSRFCPAGAAGRAYTTLMPTAEHVRTAAQAAARTCRALALPLATAVTIPPCVWERPDHPPLRVGLCSLVGPRCTVTVGPDGGVRSCSLSTDEVGNLQHEPWEVLAQRLWDQYLEPARTITPERCRSCHLWKRCYGGCRLSAQTIFGGFDHPDPLAPVSQG